MTELSSKQQDINVLELLLKISNDVSSIKTDITNLKDSQIKERDSINKDISDVKEDCTREINSVEQSLLNRINSMQAVQNSLISEVDTLKHAEEKKNANRWKTVTAFVITALGGMLLSKVPEIISYLAFTHTIQGGK